MKKTMLSAAVLMMIAFTSCKNEAKIDTEVTTTPETEIATTGAEDLAMVETTFGVRGNCGMCKETIEKAAKSVAGVSSADWNVDSKTMAVAFDEKATDEMAIHTAIANSGYDTEQVAGNEEAYNELPGCCKYDHAMEMNQSGTKM
ncbi:heavy-metal-associated domain-containing protein [Bizionia gelidisalsuginis]|uniref:Heavy-metal-associated domain-containing protein n=2 Tax=Bizionia TaxID=283785 RepID=A0A8H2LME1_9FLAO|nr:MULTISPECIES: heavy-metal-associated domain-containing protein [Bizionia]TYB74455.1 heavy-metal-associated domain-containing protein [Bizionia saleffrena]TYC16250.1 heavy-metal-associated domain-containing protein [Bizionia gelidisalsuginis]